MMKTSLFQIMPIVVTTLGMTLLTQSSLAVTQYKPDRSEFVFDTLKLKPSVSLPVIDIIEDVTADISTLKSRIIKAPKDERVEYLHLNIPAHPKDIAELARRIGRSKNTSELNKYLTEKFKTSKEKARGDGSKRVPIDMAGYKLMDPRKLQKVYARPHHNVHIDASNLRDNPNLLRQTLDQMDGFISYKQRREVFDKIMAGQNVSLEKELLPSFARKMVRKFLAYRGPNCFHASLAFHGQELTESAFINVKREDGYHRAMINYDELWRTINSHFYEVDVTRSPLKYGDMLVFFEVPDSGSKDITYFRWIRHAATYLFGPYTFSKGSKSPDTPYTVKTMEEELRTWRTYTKNLGVKVFRRSQKHVRKTPPLDLTDWIY